MMKSRLLAAIVLALLGNACIMAQKVKIDGITYEVDKKTNEAFVRRAVYKLEVANILSSVSISNHEYPVTAIRKEAFRQCYLKKVSIPNSVKIIGENAFGVCTHLEEVIVPDSTISVARNAFIWDVFNTITCRSIKTVKCQNGSFPSYMIGYIPEDSPWYMSLKYNYQADSQIAQTPSQPNPVIRDNSGIRINKPSSDVDVNLPISNTNNNKTFAVIIGNEKYTQVAEVPYAANDASIFTDYCQKTLGLPVTNIRNYDNATYGTMVSAINDIKRIAEAYNGDIRVIFYYAGHGIPNEITHDAFLLPVDANGQQTEVCYPLSRLYDELGTLGAKSVIVFMDACFSGSLRGEGMLASARGVALKPKTNVLQGNMIVFSAATGDETAYPYKEKGHGMFTYFLLKKLHETKGNCTLGELGDYIRTNVLQQSVVINRKSQTPTIVPSSAITEAWQSMKLK